MRASRWGHQTEFHSAEDTSATLPKYSILFFRNRSSRFSDVRLKVFPCIGSVSQSEPEQLCVWTHCQHIWSGTSVQSRASSFTMAHKFTLTKKYFFLQMTLDIFLLKCFLNSEQFRYLLENTIESSCRVAHRHILTIWWTACLSISFTQCIVEEQNQAFAIQ